MSIIDEEAFFSKRNKRTTTRLAEIIFRIVHDTLSEHYNGNYSIRCFQSSLLVADILSRLGIRSVIVSGAVCCPSVMGENPYNLSWRGFWDRDHHIWLMTEFYETVDLTICQLHMHPSDFNDRTQPVPAFWWYPCDYLPAVIKYLPKKERPVLEQESQADFGELKLILERNLLEAQRTNYEITPIPYDVV